MTAALSRDGLEYEVADVPVLVGANDVKSPRPVRIRRAAWVGRRTSPAPETRLLAGYLRTGRRSRFRTPNPSLEEELGELGLRFFSILGKGGI